jgi:phosphoglycerate dehydrogenase-like enzyme
LGAGFDRFNSFKMNITVLNECYLTKSHIARLTKLGRVTVYKETFREIDAVKRLQSTDAAIIHCSLLPITKKIIESAKHLKYISLASTGFDSVDLMSAKRLGITISNLPMYGTESVAEHAIGLMFSLYRHIPTLNALFHKKPYEINFLPEKEAFPYKAITLHGKTLGIIGIGKIGARVAEIARTIGMTIVAYDPFPRPLPGVNLVSFEELLHTSDIVTIHSPLNEKTKGMMGTNEFRLMKKNAVFINTARGGLVDEKALYTALKHREIAGAGLDVVVDVKKSNPLLTIPTVVFTPHSAWYSDESCTNIADTVTANIEAYVKGRPVNVIS